MRRSLEDAGCLRELQPGSTLIDFYDAWAMTVDDFAPVKIQHDVTALVRDPTDPENGPLTADGAGVVDACSVDVLAVDAADEYWVVRHQIAEGSQAPCTTRFVSANWRCGELHRYPPLGK